MAVPPAFTKQMRAYSGRNRGSIWGCLIEGPLFKYLLVTPAILLSAVLILYPALKGVWTSFHRVNLAQPWQGTPFVGLDNYANLFRDPIFWRAFRNTLIYTFGAVTGQFFLGLITALLLNRSFRGRGLVRGLILLPWVMPGVVAALMWGWMYNPDVGVINDLLFKTRIISHPIAWLADPSTAMLAVIGVAIWKGFPFFAVTLLAGLQTIPRELYEAADIDGASYLRKFIYITLPLIKEIVLITTTLRFSGIFVYADLVYVLTEGGPANATMTLPVYAFLKAYNNFDFGYAAAVSITMVLFLFVLALVYIRLMTLTRSGLG